MDNFNADTKTTIRAKSIVPQSYLALFLSLSCITVFTIGLSGCGGGGGGGSSSGGKVAVTQPPAVRGTERLTLSFGPAYDSELHSQSGLSDIGVASAYQSGYAGFNVRAGIVDTGVDQTHDQLGHYQKGHDFHGNSGGLIDPDGHGTHVASLFAARRDGRNMHGVAPHAEVNSYRIFDHNGSFGGKTGGQIIPTLVSQAIDDDIILLNNSWASNYEVTDFSKSATKSVLGNELPAWQKAVKAGMVMVWAAGNEGDDQVSVRAGLPYYYSGLKKGWLAVVSIDPTGREPRYSNRCGVARDWCLAAPGGGDSVSLAGLYGARSGGGYERRSGTSMAAPHVTGALALVLDAFPTLTAQQGAIRLLETATYEGLTTADGCTISSCTAAQMADSFGQGKISIPDALAPIGTLSLAARGAPVSAQDTALDSGLLIDEALFSAMTGVRFIAHDSFDNAAFSLPATAFLSPASSGFTYKGSEAVTMSRTATSSKGSFVYISEAGTFPTAQLGRGELADISLRDMQQWSGMGLSDPLGQWQAHLGLDETRQVLLIRRSLQSLSGYSQSKIASDSWASIGIDQADGRFLDSQGTGGMRWDKGQGVWANFGHFQPLIKGAISMEYQIGKSWASAMEHCVICAGAAQFRRWQISYQRPIFTGQTEFEVAFHQPLHVTKAAFDLAGANYKSVQLRPIRPKREVAFHLTNPAFGGALRLSHQMKSSNRDSASYQGLFHQISAQWQLSF